MGKNEFAIQKERERDNMVATYKKIGDANTKLMNRIQWEHSTQETIQKSNIARIAQRLETQREERLQNRRTRLTELLAADDAQLKKELNALTETPQERRARLQEKAAQLKQQKEQKRIEYVEKQLRRQFRANTDELRTAGDKTLMMLCERDRRQQIERKAFSKAFEEMEKEKWEHVWQQNIEEQIQRESKELEEKKKIDALTYDEIGNQLEAIRAERQKQKATKEMEAQESLRIMKEEEEKEKERHRRYLEKAAAQRAEIERYNSEVQAKKAEEALRKERDGPEISSLPALMTETEDNLLERKKQLVGDMRQFLAYRQEQQRQSQQRELELESLRNAELERLARRQDLIWQKEQLAREKLMREVIETRQMQLLEKAEAHRRMLELQNVEGSACILAQSEDPEEAVAARRAEFAEALKRQIAERQFHAEMERAALHYETLEAQIAEQEYQQRLRAEIEADEAKLQI